MPAKRKSGRLAKQSEVKQAAIAQAADLAQAELKLVEQKAEAAASGGDGGDANPRGPKRVKPSTVKTVSDHYDFVPFPAQHQIVVGDTVGYPVQTGEKAEYRLGVLASSIVPGKWIVDTTCSDHPNGLVVYEVSLRMPLIKQLEVEAERARYAATCKEVAAIRATLDRADAKRVVAKQLDDFAEKQRKAREEKRKQREAELKEIEQHIRGPSKLTEAECDLLEKWFEPKETDGAHPILKTAFGNMDDPNACRFGGGGEFDYEQERRNYEIAKAREYIDRVLKAESDVQARLGH